MLAPHRLILAAAIATAPMTGFAVSATASAGPIYLSVEEQNPIAVSGYDTVSYFQGSGVPIKGSAQYSVEHRGAKWHFASQENADKFKADPDAYAPQYGGHCAWAMSRGSLAPGDPTLYRVESGKLYLNFNRQVQKTWLSDISGFIEKADAAWTQIPEDASFGG